MSSSATIDVSAQPERRFSFSALVVVGDRDPFVPVDQAWELARLLPKGSLLVVPDCPHEVMTRRASLVNEALARFYRGILTP